MWAMHIARVSGAVSQAGGCLASGHAVSRRQAFSWQPDVKQRDMIIHDSERIEGEVKGRD